MSNRRLPPLLLACLFLLLPLVTAAPAAASTERSWQVYTGVNAVLAIHVGPRYVWSATDGGLLVYEKRTGRFRRLDVNEGLPGSGTYAVAPESGTAADTVWLLVRGERWGRNYLVRVTLRSWDAAPVLQYWLVPTIPPHPTLSLQYLAGDTAELTVGPEQVRIVSSNAVWTFDRHARRWTVTDQTQKESEEWERDHPGSRNGANQVGDILAERDSGGRVRQIFLVSGDDPEVTEYLPGQEGQADRLLRYALAPSVPAKAPWTHLSMSVAFHLRLGSTGEPSRSALTYDVIETRSRSLPAGFVTYSYSLLTWRHAPERAGGWQLLSRRPVSDAELPALRAQVARMVIWRRAPFPLVMTVRALGFDAQTNTLWAGGNGGLARYDLNAQRGEFFRRQPGEVRMGVNGTIRHFDARAGRPVLFTYASDDPRLELTNRRHEYDITRNLWIETRPTPAQAEADGGPRWRKVSVPFTPRSGEKPQLMQGRVAAENGRWSWLLWPGNSVARIGDFPTPFTQPPVRVDLRTGKIRFFRELFGYHTLAVAPFGDGGSAWLLAAPLGQDARLGKRILFRYDAATDALTPFENPLLGTSGQASYADDPACLAAISNGTGVVALRGGGSVLLFPATSAKEFVVISLPVPANRSVRTVQAGRNRFVIALNEPTGGNVGPVSFQLLDPAEQSLRALPLPQAIRTLEPHTSLLIGDRLWLAGNSGVASLTLPASNGTGPL